MKANSKKKAPAPKAPKVDWKLKTLQLLKCFGEVSGSWHESYWESYGISRAEALQIIKEYEKINKSPDSPKQPQTLKDQPIVEDQQSSGPVVLQKDHPDAS